MSGRDLDWFLLRAKGICLQQWHMFVVWYAYQEFIFHDKAEKKFLEESVMSSSGVLKYWITCPELILWVYEVAYDEAW